MNFLAQKLKYVITVLLVLFLFFSSHAESFYNSVKDYGAKGDGVVLDTKAIQKAIDEANEHGGGTVFFPAGKYLSGTIFFKSNVIL